MIRRRRPLSALHSAAQPKPVAAPAGQQPQPSVPPAPENVTYLHEQARANPATENTDQTIAQPVAQTGNVILEPGVIPLAPHVMEIRPQETVAMHSIVAANRAAVFGWSAQQQRHADQSADDAFSSRNAHFNVRLLAQALRRPPDVGPTYHAYNQLRQLYVLEQAARHFSSRVDDPVPLYDKHLLDVGCGASTVSQFLALAGAEITAIDPDTKALNVARTAAEAYGTPVTFVATKAEQLITEPTRFDVILALDVLEDVADPAKLIRVLRQLLAPGGMIVISAINRSFMAWFLHIFLSNRVYGRTAQPRQWQRFYRPEELTAMATSQALRVENQQLLHFSLRLQQWLPVAPGPSRVPGLFSRFKGKFTLRGGTRYLMTLSA